MQCCAVYSRKQCEILYFQECSPLEADEQRKNLNDIILYVNDFKFLKIKDIQKIHTSNGIWYLSLDLRNCCHLVYCQKNYPEPSGLRFLSQMKRLVCDVNQYDTKPQNISKFLSNRIYNLIKGYNADPSYDDDYQNSDKSIQSITIDIPDNQSPTRIGADPRNSKSQYLQNSQGQLPSNFYPKPTTSMQFNEYLCYGSLLLIAFLMLILIIIKVS